MRLPSTKSLVKGMVMCAVFGFLWYNFSVSSSTTRVSGASMSPTYSDGQELAIHQRAADEYPDRSDVVLIRKNNTTYIKRIIALPNETIDIKNDMVYVDGKVVCAQGGISENITDTWEYPIKLDKNEYFVMGDNRTNSFDSRSRSFGVVPIKEILAIVVEE